MEGYRLQSAHGGLARKDQGSVVRDRNSCDGEWYRAAVAVSVKFL